jgi:hypothetical protein
MLAGNRPIRHIRIAQGKKPADDDRREHPEHGQTTPENGPSAVRLDIAVSGCELMAQKIDALVVPNLIKAHPRCECLSQRLQWGLLQPGKKCGGREQYGGRITLCAPLYRDVDLLDLLIGEPVGFVEDKQRAVCLCRV